MKKFGIVTIIIALIGAISFAAKTIISGRNGKTEK